MKKADALQKENWPKIEPRVPFSQFPAVRLAFRERKVRLSPLKPNHSPTTAWAGNFGTISAAAGCAPLSITSGRYTDNAPVFVLMMVASTNADCESVASSQPPPAGSVAVS
ncbi:MAG TPA: hypothetical protein VHV74_23765 [Pseudonocardiaceae bacterium]|nr:hypothetical protein [Pseudonocardiaceae bacterium]